MLASNLDPHLLLAPLHTIRTAASISKEGPISSSNVHCLFRLASLLLEGDWFPLTCLGIPRWGTSFCLASCVKQYITAIWRLTLFLSFWANPQAADKYPYFPGQEPSLRGDLDFLLQVCCWLLVCVRVFLFLFFFSFLLLTSLLVLIVRSIRNGRM